MVDLCVSNELLLPDVRLHSIIDDLSSWVRVTPKVGSKVLCGCIEDYKANYMCIIKTSEIEKVDFKIGNKTLEMTKDGFVFNGGNYHGLIKIEALWDKLKDLESKFNGHTHIIGPDDGVVATMPSTPPVTYAVTGVVSSIIVLEQSNKFQSPNTYNSIEDEFVKH